MPALVPRLALLALAAALLGAAPVATGRETVRCSLNDGPEQACVLIDQAGRGGTHRMSFAGPRIRVSFVGRANSGWWSGRLNGKPAMGYERNRGNVVFSTTDLSTRFAWWYSGSAHGTY